VEEYLRSWNTECFFEELKWNIIERKKWSVVKNWRLVNESKVIREIQIILRSISRVWRHWRKARTNREVLRIALALKKAVGRLRKKLQQLKKRSARRETSSAWTIRN